MATNRTAWLTAITSTSTTAEEDLGAVRDYFHATYKWGQWVYIKNGSASALAQGLGAMQENGTSLFEAELSGANCEMARMLGIADHAIAAGSYGWVIKDGYCKIKAAAAGITANTAVEAAANGLFDDGVVGTDELVAFALETVASGSLSLAKVSF